MLFLSAFICGKKVFIRVHSRPNVFAVVRVPVPRGEMLFLGVNPRSSAAKRLLFASIRGQMSLLFSVPPW
jgi:hypothetical protein